MATITFFTRATNPDKKVSVRVRFRHGKHINIYAKSGLELFPRQFSNETHTISQRVKYKDKSKDRDYLNGLEVSIEKAYKELETLPTSDWLNNIVDKYRFPDKYKKKPITLFSFIQKFIDAAPTRTLDSGHVATSRTIKDYKTTFEDIKSFALYESKNEYDFSDIDRKFYERYKKYLLYKRKFAVNTAGKKIKVLKIFLNAASPEHISSDQFKGFTTLTEKVDSIYLNEKELQDLADLDLTNNKRLEKVRDLFLVGCWTGLRFGDWNKVRSENIEDGVLTVRQEKTGIDVEIPIHPTVKAILDKYDGKLPKTISNQKFNDYLSEVAKLAKFKKGVTKQAIKAGKQEATIYLKWQLVTTHTARRSFATNLYNSKFPTISIMAITGHKTETAFLKYIKVTPKEHANLLIEHWRKSGDHLKLAK